MAGQTLTSQSVPIAFRKNSGGLNSTSSALSLADNEASDLQNVDFNRFGSILKRKGSTQLNSSVFNSGATFVGLHWLQLSSGTKFLIGVAGDALAKMDGLDGTWDDITGGLTITAGNANLVSSITFRNNYLATNNVDAPWLWDGIAGTGSTMTVPTGLTRAKFIEVFQNFTTFANVRVSGTDHNSRVYWSAVGEIATWDAADFADINRDDGSDVTGSKALGEEWIIFKEFSIHKGTFTGDRDIPFLFNKTRSTVGCISGYSIQEVENGLFFRARDGYYFFDGNNSFKVSDRINVTLDGNNQSKDEFTTSAFLRTKNRYYSSATDSAASTHDTGVIWDSFNNAWSIYKGQDPSVWVIVNVAGEERIYFGDYSGFVYRADIGVDDEPSGVTTAIDAFYKTKWYDHTDIVNQKGINQLILYHQVASTILGFAYSFDFEDADQFTQTIDFTPGGSLYGSALYGTGVYGTSGGAVKRRDLTGRGRVVRFHFSNSTLGEGFQLDGFGTLPHLETIR